MIFKSLLLFGIFSNSKCKISVKIVKKKVEFYIFKNNVWISSYKRLLRW